VSPKCPHFLKTRGTVRDLHGLKGTEKTKDRGQVVDKINESLGSHGGDRGSKPLGTASNIRGLLINPHSLAALLLTSCQHFFSPVEVAASSGFFSFGVGDQNLRGPVVEGHQVYRAQQFHVADSAVPLAH
jgi:hypothetical protein